MIFEMPSCGGCRTCEMACSFKHTEEFSPEISSIKILEKENGPGFLVSLVEENDGRNIACDGCKEFGVPLCMQYCRESEDLRGILKEFMERNRVKGEVKKINHTSSF